MMCKLKKCMKKVALYVQIKKGGWIRESIIRLKLKGGWIKVAL